MTYIYYIDNKKYITENYDSIPFLKISMPDEKTPAYFDTRKNIKLWCEKGLQMNYLKGPALVSNDYNFFWLNNKNYFNNVTEWLKNHPNQDNVFQVEMLLKYS
jgi:hypothetical protein